ncbi:unnamed protein product [Mytilus edulis]|uniref:RNase H type-1 domain-containing protein n=1 Tax=Mytilus edulis TaxID=6550 RepID=A0A8S3PVG2_MYTED|nr:unnamed protein product [Mytilus edulis]
MISFLLCGFYLQWFLSQFPLLSENTTGQTVTSADFDTTLIVCLLRNLAPSESAPVTGWDNLPQPGDTSTGADLARVKWYRNQSVHSKDGILSSTDFNQCWGDLEGTDQSIEIRQTEKTYEQQDSPFGKAINQSIDMFKATKVDIKLIEPEFTYKAGVDVMLRRSPSYWSRLGSSKNRTAEQTVESKQVVKDLLGDSTDSTVVAFTDGSCQGNPGPCGAGAVVYSGNSQGISLKRPVANRGSILLAELVAILMVLEHCITTIKDQFSELKILSDSQTAVGILTLNWKSSNYIDTITDIKE